MGSGTHLSDPAAMYNYAIRRLLERVTWFVRDHGGETTITFAHIKRFPYAKLRDYLSILQLQPTEIVWDRIKSTKIDQPSRVKLLQVADLSAGCLTRRLIRTTTATMSTPTCSSLRRGSTSADRAASSRTG